MLRLGSLTAFIILVPSAATAYPISPVTLWSLVEQADLIVLAETRELVRLERGSDWHDTEAVLKVLETWHGPKSEEVRVPFPAGMICPAPPRYVAGEMVLAFLAKDENSGLYETIGLSYGALYPHFDDLGAWKAAVASAIELRVHGRPSEHDRRRWLVEIAARRATRWHGVYELDPGSDRMHSFYDQARRTKPVLSPVEKAILARGIIKEPSMDKELVAILRLLRHYPDAAVDAVAVAATDRMALDESRAYFFGDLVELTIERVDRKAAPPQSSDSVEKNAASARSTWAKTRLNIQVDTSAVVFPTARPPRVRGTGSETPS